MGIISLHAQVKNGQVPTKMAAGQKQIVGPLYMTGFQNTTVVRVDHSFEHHDWYLFYPLMVLQGDLGLGTISCHWSL